MKLPDGSILRLVGPDAGLNTSWEVVQPLDGSSAIIDSKLYMYFKTRSFVVTSIDTINPTLTRIETPTQPANIQVHDVLRQPVNEPSESKTVPVKHNQSACIITYFLCCIVMCSAFLHCFGESPKNGSQNEKARIFILTEKINDAIASYSC